MVTCGTTPLLKLGLSIASAAAILLAPVAFANEPCKARSLVGRIEAETLKEYEAAATVKSQNADAYDYAAGASPTMDLTGFETPTQFAMEEDLAAPMRPTQPWAAVYVGEGSPAWFSVPRDSRVFCYLKPATLLLLSDGFTHHYAMVRKVDYDASEVWISDNWAKNSFLLEGKNVLDVKAKAIDDHRSRPYLRLSFGDFLKVIVGFVEADEPGNLFSSIFDNEAPTNAARSEEIVYWVLIVAISGDALSAVSDFDEALATQRGFVPSKRILALKQFVADRSAIAQLRGRDNVNFGSVAETIDAARFLERLAQYAPSLTWRLKWKLIADAKELLGPELTTQICNTFLLNDPNDVDILIEHGRALLQLGKAHEALSSIHRADEIWSTTMLRVFKTKLLPEAKKRLFEDINYFDVTNILAWRYARIQLLQLAGNLALSGNHAPLEQALKSLRLEYGDEIQLDFLPEILLVAGQTRGANVDVQAIAEAARLSLADAGPGFTHPWDSKFFQVASAVFEYVATKRSIVELNGKLPRRLRENLRQALCAIQEDREDAHFGIHGEAAHLLEVIDSYCTE